MAIEKIHLIGAGGHGKVVLDAMLRAGLAADRITVFDENPALHGGSLFDFRIHALPGGEVLRGVLFHVAIGDAAVRARLHGRWEKAGGLALTVAHPAATVSPFAVVGAGVFAAAGAVIGPAATVAIGVIINHGAIVDHDCRIGAFSHLAPHAALGGGVTVGDGVLVGAGACILPGRTIGAGAVVGAGTIVLEDVPTGMTVVGVPARNIS